MHELVDRLAGGAISVDRDLEQEFEVRLRESSTLAFRVAYGVVRHREDAEDIAQDAFAKAYRSFHQLRDRERFRAWLVRMTWRLAISHLRATKRREARELAPLDDHSAPTAEQTVDANRRSVELWKAIDQLPVKLRMALVLASIEGHDMKEVASLLRVPVGTVKSRVFLARERLREQLQWTR